MTQKGKLAAFTRATFSKALTEAQFDAAIRIAEGYHILAKKGYPDSDKTAIEILNLIGQQFPSQGKQREALLDAFFKEVKVPNSPFRKSAYEMFTNVALVLDKSALNPTAEGKRLTDFIKKELDYSTNNLRELREKKPYVEKKMQMLNELGNLTTQGEIQSKIEAIQKEAEKRQAAIIERQTNLAKVQLAMITKVINCNSRESLKNLLNEAETKKNLKVLLDEKERLSKLLKGHDWDPHDASIRKKIIGIEFLENLQNHDALKEMTPTDIKQFAKDHVATLKLPEEIKLEKKLEELDTKMKHELELQLKEVTKPIESLKKVKDAESLKQLRNSWDPLDKEILETTEREIYSEKSWLPSWLPLAILRVFSTLDMTKEIQTKVEEKSKTAKNDRSYLELEARFKSEREDIIKEIKDRQRETKALVGKLTEEKDLNKPAYKDLIHLIKSQRESLGLEAIKAEAQNEQQKQLNVGVSSEQMAKQDSEYKQIQTNTIEVLSRVKATLNTEGVEGLKGNKNKRGLLEKEKDACNETFELLAETQKENDELVKQFEITLKEDVSYNVGKSRFVAIKALLSDKINPKTPGMPATQRIPDINTLGFENSIIQAMAKIDSLTYKKSAIDMLPTLIEQEREELSFKSKILQSLLSPEIQSYVSNTMNQELAYLSRTVVEAPNYSKPTMAGSNLGVREPEGAAAAGSMLGAVGGTLTNLGKRLKDNINKIMEIRDTFYAVKGAVSEVQANSEKDLKLTEDYVRTHLRQARDDISNITFSVLKNMADSLGKIIAANPEQFSKRSPWVSSLKKIDEILEKVKTLDARYEDFISTHKNMENTAEYRLQISKLHKKRNELYKLSRDQLITLSNMPPEEHNFHLASLLSLVHRTMGGITDLQDGVNAFEGAYRVVSNKLTGKHVNPFEALESAGEPAAPEDDKVKLAKGVLNTALEKFDSKNLQETLLNKFLEQQLGFLDHFNAQLDSSLIKERLPKNNVTSEDNVEQVLEKLRQAATQKSELSFLTAENKLLKGTEAALKIIDNLKSKANHSLPQWVETFRLLKKLGVKGDATNKILSQMLKDFKEKSVSAKIDFFDHFNVSNNACLQNTNASDKIVATQLKATAFKEFKQQFLMLTPKQQDYLKDVFKNEFNLISETLNLKMERQVILNSMKEANAHKKQMVKSNELENDRKLLEALFLEFNPGMEEVNKFKTALNYDPKVPAQTSAATPKAETPAAAANASVKKAEGLSSLAARFAIDAAVAAAKPKPQVLTQFVPQPNQTTVNPAISSTVVLASDSIEVILSKIKASSGTHDPSLSFKDSTGKVLRKKEAAKNIVLALQNTSEELPLAKLLEAIKCIKAAKVDVSDIGGTKIYSSALADFKTKLDSARQNFIAEYSKYTANLRLNSVSGPDLAEREKAVEAIAPKLERYKYLERDFNQAMGVQHKGKGLLVEKADAKQIKAIKDTLDIGLENQKNIFDKARSQYEKAHIISPGLGAGIGTGTGTGLSNLSPMAATNKPEKRTPH